MPSPEDALPGRDDPMPLATAHFVSGNAVTPPFPDGLELAVFGMGCFWGAERRFWGVAGVFSTQVGYAGGYTPNPIYQEVCTGLTGHAEVVRVVHDPRRIGFRELLRVFWESHDPTQGMQQGSDVGTQYRSCIFTTSQEQVSLAHDTAELFQQELSDRSLGDLTTQIAPLARFYYAEEYHQQYLARNPTGYCGLVETGVRLPA
ncbi:MAG: peptide-methionine (S)-S-oxide reductase MsrA [Pseudomonadota bacterium]